MSERDLIARIRELFPRAGDDAAVIGRQVITNDVLVENADIAAMGGRPRYAIVAIGSPDEKDASTVIEELAVAAKENDVEIAGGDLSRSEHLFISITLIGEASQPILRSGARRGDRVYLSRPIGGSSAGLSLLQRGTEGADYAEREFIESAKRRHLEPEAEVALGMKLVSIATSCIDVSDGFSTDLHHLCDASKVGALIDGDRIPAFQDLPRYGPRLGVNVRDAVLHGGEEYALLFTSALRESELSARVGRPVYAVGRITQESGVRINGELLEPRGFDHFA
jgi:thiamine-monophosphate kinase